MKAYLYKGLTCIKCDANGLYFNAQPGSVLVVEDNVTLSKMIEVVGEGENAEVKTTDAFTEVKVPKP